jgi:Arc/MetJ-type ribon-helix-helix transcriptional regulator
MLAHNSFTFTFGDQLTRLCNRGRVADGKRERRRTAMTITLQGEQERAIEEAIQAGAFRSVDEFIEAAISMLPNVPARGSSAPPRKSRLWELRKGLSLGELSIRELIEEGRE